MWADVDYELVESIPSIRITYNDKWEALVFFYLVTFCSCLLTSIRIFALKKKIWNGLNTPVMGPYWKNVISNMIKKGAGRLGCGALKLEFYIEKFIILRF